MTRTAAIRFGTFGPKLGTPVYSQGWWFCVVADVFLEGIPTPSETLAEHVGSFGLKTPLPLLQQVPEACWVRACVPIAFQCNLPSSYTGDTIIRLGFFAARAEAREAEVAYPFLCIDRHGRTALWFSSLGPDEVTRRSIGKAFWMRLLNAADCLTDFEVTVVEPDTGARSHYLCRNGRLLYKTERE